MGNMDGKAMGLDLTMEEEFVCLGEQYVWGHVADSIYTSKSGTVLMILTHDRINTKGKTKEEQCLSKHWYQMGRGCLGCSQQRARFYDAWCVVEPIALDKKGECVVFAAVWLIRNKIIQLWQYYHSIKVRWSIRKLAKEWYYAQPKEWS